MLNTVEMYCKTIIRPLEEKVNKLSQDTFKTKCFASNKAKLLEKYETELYNRYIELGRMLEQEYELSTKI